MEIIISRENKLFKKLIKLKEKKHRKECGEFIAEGERWILDALNCGREFSIKCVILCEDRLDDGDKLLKEYPFLKDKIFVLKKELFLKAALTETPPGIMIIHSIIEPKTEFPKNGLCLFLDRIRDPGNLGMILRSAAACGFTDVVLNDSADEYNPKTVRSCMTGLLYLNIFSGLSIEILKELGYKILSADMGGENVFNKKKSSDKLCLVIGNEANGISNEILGKSDCVISLPMLNVESLNAGAAATTLMYILTNK